MNGYTTARVQLWGRDVGLLLESERGVRITFEYDPGFADSGLEISPIHLPLARSGPVSFPELAGRPAFLGLPGVFADALPDRFGNAVIRRYFEARGRPEDALSPLQRLLYVGERAMGALEFLPPHDPGPGTEEALEVQVLVDQARRVIDGDVSIAVPEMMQVGGSAGGARPKALILWDRETGRVRSGFANPDADEELWLIKFDGVSRDASGLGMHAHRHPGPWGRVEYAYSRMARDAGIRMAKTHLLRDGDLAHFMTRRFDRTDVGRLHLHSLGGLQHIDFNDQFVFSYEGWFDTIRTLEMGQASVNEAFRRMVLGPAQPRRPAAHRLQRPVRVQLRRLVRHDPHLLDGAGFGERGVRRMPARLPMATWRRSTSTTTSRTSRFSWIAPAAGSWRPPTT